MRVCTDTDGQVTLVDRLLENVLLAADSGDTTSERAPIIAEANALLSKVCEAPLSPQRSLQLPVPLVNMRRKAGPAH